MQVLQTDTAKDPFGSDLLSSCNPWETRRRKEDAKLVLDTQVHQPAVDYYSVMYSVHSAVSAVDDESFTGLALLGIGICTI